MHKKDLIQQIRGLAYDYNNLADHYEKNSITIDAVVGRLKIYKKFAQGLKERSRETHAYMVRRLNAIKESAGYIIEDIDAYQNDETIPMYKLAKEMNTQYLLLKDLIEEILKEEKPEEKE